MTVTSPLTLRSARIDRGLTQAALARLAGVDTRTVQRAEYGEHQPSRLVREALAAALCVPVADLFPPAHGANGGTQRAEAGESQQTEAPSDLCTGRTLRAPTEG